MSAAPPTVQVRPPVATPTKTGRRPWSTMLLREWASNKYPGIYLAEQLRLGPTPVTLLNVTVTPALEAMLRVENWYADGLLITPIEVLLIEAKIAPTPGAISQVLFYQRLAMRTPELAGTLHLPFTPVVLFAEDDAEVTAFARHLGVRVEIFTPSWIGDYLTLVQFRRRLTASPGANLVTTAA